MKKYGFVYIWYDHKHKRYYIGCRWGNEDDGYICSSPWMKRGYKKRPNDFKRRILKRVYTNKKDLLEEEYNWLKLIKNDELGKKYYNLHNHHFNHWSTDENNKLSVSEKIKINHSIPEVRKRLSEAKIGDKNPMKRQEVVDKRLETYRKNNSKIIKPKRMNKQELKVFQSEFSKSRVWYVNPETNKCIHILKTEIPPEGFIQGRCKFKKKKIPKNYSATKEWIIIKPDGTEIKIKNLSKWAKENGLNDNALRDVAYNRKKHHKQYKCRLAQ